MSTFFHSILREPDSIKIQTERSTFRFEERDEPNTTDAQVTFSIRDNVMQVILHPSDDAVLRLRLRFRCDMSGIVSVWGDGCSDLGCHEGIWSPMVPHKTMDWYFHALEYTTDGLLLHSYGVKTGANSFASWLCDPSGITLWLDVRNGTGGTQLKEPLVCAELLCREGQMGEEPYTAARKFCQMLCDNPKNPPRSVYGFNNWYWAYGNIDAKTVVEQSRYLGQLCRDFAEPDNRPFMVMDDGWQSHHTNISGVKYNGGPWEQGNERFPSMAALAEEIHRARCRAGLWFRPLLTMGHVPADAILPPVDGRFGVLLDPTHPYSAQRIADDTARIAGWGFDLIKFDFTSADLLNGHPENIRVPHLYDRTVTNAQAVKQLYHNIADHSGDALVLACDAVNHLSAGIFPVRRCGDDTSGRLLEITVRNGVHTFLRLPQNRTFFAVDVDCAVFTDKVNGDINLDFLEATAISGCPVFASVTPGILTDKEEARLREIFRLAATHSPEEDAVPMDWAYTTVPGQFRYQEQTRRYDWFREYDGSRRYMSFMG